MAIPGVLLGCGPDVPDTPPFRFAFLVDLFPRGNTEFSACSCALTSCNKERIRVEHD